MLEIYSGREFLATELDTIPYLIHPIVPSTGIVLLHGAPGVGKSTITWQMANALESGTEFLHLKTARSRVLFLSLDMPKYGLYHRWKETNFDPLFDVAFVDTFDVCDPGFRYSKVYAALKERHIAQHYGLVIVDALGRVITRSVINDELPNVVYSTFTLWFPNACILFLHHDRKRKVTESGRLAEASEEDASGNTFWRAFATITLHLWRVNRSIVRLEHTKSQIGPMIDSIDLYMNEFGTNLEIYDEYKQRLDAKRLMESEAILRQQHPRWDKFSRMKRIQLTAQLCGVSTSTVYRWYRSVEAAKTEGTLEGVS